MYIQVFSFFKARDVIQKFWMSETTQSNTLQKHLKSGICWKVKHIIQLSRVLQGEVIQVFFLFKHIQWLFSYRVSSSWTPLQHLFITHKF